MTQDDLLRPATDDKSIEARVAAIFQAVDKDGDDKLSLTDFESFHIRRGKKETRNLTRLLTGSADFS